MANPQRSTTVVTEAVGDGLGVFDAQRKQSYVLNATSALVFQHCDGQTTPQQLTERLRQKFNVSPSQAEQLLGLALDELQKANLLQTSVQRPANPGRRQLFKTMAAAGLSLALLPMVAPVEVQAGGHDDVIPILECVADNGNGTFTAFFGYVNENSSAVTIPIGPKNKFNPAPQNRGQPTVFQPGRQTNVFSVAFQGNQHLVWKLKFHGDKERSCTASRHSPRCAPPPTTTVAPPPTTTVAPPPTTTVAPPPTTTVAPPPTTTVAPPPTTTFIPPD